MKKSTIILIIVLVVIAMPILTAISSYNGLVSGRESVNSASSQIDNQLQRRNDLIPNLIETVKGYAAYEGETFEKITELRAQVAKAETPAEAMQASNALTKQISGIFAVAENYPDLKANNSFVKLQDELTNTENKISYSRQLFNSTTSNYNVKLETFPSNFIAGMFGFQPSQFLEIPEEEKEVPKVSF